MPGGSPLDFLHMVRLSAKQRELVEILASAYPRALSVDVVADQLYQLDPNGGPDDPANIVAVMTSRINPIIRQHGWEIASRKGFGGYRLFPIEDGDR